MMKWEIMDAPEESEMGSAVIGKNWQVQCTMLAVSIGLKLESAAGKMGC